MAEPVEAVLFDIDDTLCAYRHPGSELLADAFASEGVEPFFEVGEYYERFDEFAARYDAIDVLRTECFAAIADDRGRDPATGRAVATHYEAARDHRDVTFLPGAREAIDALADDHRLGVVTNGGPGTQDPKLDALGLIHQFETIVYAGYGIPPKPDPAPFERALADLDTRSERAVHVGNSLTADVAGAHAAGLRSVWIPDVENSDAGENTDTDTDAGHADYTLGSLCELLSPPWG